MGRKLGACVAAIGLFTTSAAAWFLMKGPFLGTGLPATEYLLAAIATLLVGLLLLRSGLNSYIHHRSSTDRVVISNKKI
ncbi:hypothetical protein G9C85_10115 [Halorubellus sp. JP-L1]|uniref:hypothetical protein n=1 Tax=Halorubellus sp. JP-L1 TaxID=2715753 RepID=UPI00140AA21C|nr:hypothetical protein [Halorubellus sp. JP-L1]NHN41981.1 hypothetical protein [Halorubellus sp. JP-L1]